MSRSYADEIEQIAWDADRSPLDVLEWFLERAAIREYDGGMSRDDAEDLAVQDVADALSVTRCVNRVAGAEGKQVLSDCVKPSQQPASSGGAQ